MKSRLSATLLTAVVLIALPASIPSATAQDTSRKVNAPKTMHAKGTFEVKMVPSSEDKSENSTLGRMTNEKQFHGDLEGTSKGEMLTAMSSVKGSAGYVLIERVSGTLNGKKGTFVLQHSATMDRGKPQMSVVIVPDTGSGELSGIAGKFTIDIRDGKHFYELDYTLPE